MHIVPSKYDPTIVGWNEVAPRYRCIFYQPNFFCKLLCITLYEGTWLNCEDLYFYLVSFWRKKKSLLLSVLSHKKLVLVGRVWVDKRRAKQFYKNQCDWSTSEEPSISQKQQRLWTLRKIVNSRMVELKCYFNISKSECFWMEVDKDGVYELYGWFPVF